MASKATLIEAAEYLRTEARMHDQVAGQLEQMDETERAWKEQHQAKTFHRWADHVEEAAEEQ